MINKNLPLVDLHRHLDGNIRPKTILELGQQHNLILPANTYDTLLPYVQVQSNEPDLLSFLAKLDWGVKVLADYDACRRVAYENVEDAYLDNIDYTELRFSPWYMAMTHNLKLEGVIEAVIDGIKSGISDFGVMVKLIGIMSRTFGEKMCQSELDACLAFKDQFIAMDLAGDEGGKPGSLFIDHFKQARNAGLNITVHAGEASGANSIWQAINELGANRIGHAVRATEDPKLLDYLAKHQIGIESCITSNLQTSTVADIKLHPLKTFLDNGILATINTDDPAVEGINLTHEYTVAAPNAGLLKADIHQAQVNGITIAYLSDSEKKILYNKKLNEKT